LRWLLFAGTLPGALFGTFAIGPEGYAAVIGLIWPLGVVAEILLFVFSARVVRRIDPVMLIGIGAAACALRWSLMALDPGPLPLLIAQLLHGLTFAVPHLGAMYFILRATPPRLSATAAKTNIANICLTL